MSGSATFTIVTSMSSMHAPAQTATNGHHLRIPSSFPATLIILVRLFARPRLSSFLDKNPLSLALPDS